MGTSSFVRRHKNALRIAATLVALTATGCSSGASTAEDELAEAPKTPIAVFEAQSKLYDALFEDPPDVEAAALLMSTLCQEKFADAENVVGVVLTEVEVAQSADISKKSVLSIFSEISYVIEDDIASGDDGSEWVYEQGGWRSTDC